MNQYTVVGSAAPTYDPNGNLTFNGATTYGYDAENRLVSSSTGASLVYDPTGRLWQTSGGGASTTQFLYDGDQLTAEYDGGGGLLRRYVHGTGEDDPLLWYEGSGLGDRRSLQTDHQGSVVSVADASGNALATNSYDEYGVPAAGNLGRFQYTGQAWLPNLGLYYYKARIYDPKVGRFLQTDPVGYDDQINLYNYVADDPVNGRDPTGLEGACFYGPSRCNNISTPSLSTAANLIDAVSVAAIVLETVLTGGTSALGPNEAELSIERAASSALRQAGKTDVVVTSKGTSVLKSQNAMETGFKRAGIQARDLAGKGRQYEIPGSQGNRVRAMEPQANGAGRRASFENSRGSPVSPDGKPVQPPRGTQDTQKYVRDRTHIKQDE